MLEAIMSWFKPSFQKKTDKILRLFNRSTRILERMNDEIEKQNELDKKAIAKIAEKMTANVALQSKNSTVVRNFKILLGEEEGELNLSKDSKEDAS